MTFRPPLYMQNQDLFSYAAQDDRFLIDTLFSEGILNVGGGQGLVVQRPEGANMTVSVPAFDAIVKGDDATLQGSYLLRMTVAESATVTAAPATNSRIDLLVVEVIDSTYRAITTANPEGPRLRVIAGTASATPVVPTLPATAIPLAQIAVAAGQASIQTANITDLRTQAGAATLKVGTQAEPLTATQIAALATAARFPGRLIENITTGKLQHVPTAGAVPIDVGGLPAYGRLNPSLSIVANTYTTLSFFIGTGFTEAEFTLTGSGAMTFRALVTANPGQAQLVGALTSSPLLGSPVDATTTFAAGNNSCLVRNLRLDPDGFIRWEVTAGASPTATYSINWRAR